MPPKKLKKSKKAAQTEAWLAAVAASQKRTNEQLQDKAVSKVSSALAIQTNKPANKSQPNTLMDFSFSSLSTLSSSSSLLRYRQPTKILQLGTGGDSDWRKRAPTF